MTIKRRPLTGRDNRKPGVLIALADRRGRILYSRETLLGKNENPPATEPAGNEKEAVPHDPWSSYHRKGTP